MRREKASCRFFNHAHDGGVCPVPTEDAPRGVCGCASFVPFVDEVAKKKRCDA